MTAYPHLWAHLSGRGYVASFVISYDGGRSWSGYAPRSVRVPFLSWAKALSRAMAARENRRRHRHDRRRAAADAADRAMRGRA